MHCRPILSLGPFLLALNFLGAEAAVVSTAARGNHTAKVNEGYNALVVKRFEIPVGPYPRPQLTEARAEGDKKSRV